MKSSFQFFKSIATNLYIKLFW